MRLPRRLPRPSSLTVLSLLAIGSLSGVCSQNYYNNNGNNNAYQNNQGSGYNNNQNYNYYNNQNYNDDAAQANNNNNNYYNDDGNNNNNNAAYDDQYNGNNNNAAYQGDDQYNNDAYQQNDDVAVNDDGANGDDDANGDDAAANDDLNADKYYEENVVDDQMDAAWEDDLFHWNPNVGFDGVSIMPVSCINYNNGHMIKFEMFETDNSYQCHFAQIGTFVVSIAHYMRAYFNYEALEQGRDFSLPSDAGYLNCIMLQDETQTSIPLYAKAGCMERETFTSTKLQLHVYTDSQCSVPYDDGRTARSHANRGYLLENARGEEFMFSTKVSFRPPFYTCQSCNVEEISDTFNKQAGTWYDDDYISQNGQKQQMNEDADEGNDDANANNNDDQANNNQDDDYYQDDGHVDDTYMSANDDIYRYNNNGYNNGGNRALMLRGDEDGDHIRSFTPVPGELERFEAEFWSDVAYQQRQRELYDNNYSIDDWNMCQQVYKYGLYCDDQCRSLDAFRTDRWSGADIILLSIMCTFMAAMMLLIVAKRLKASQKQRNSFQYYERDTESSSTSMPGLPPVAMFAIFVSVMIIIVVLAEMKFVNETLVFAVVTCVLLFIYMLKLTLFASRKPVLLAAPKHEMFDNPLDEHLFT